MANGKFTQQTKNLIAARAGYMCTNPDCNRLLVGPELTRVDNYMRIGEAAHIRGEKKAAPRYDASMSDAARADSANGIWLCPNCHTMIDKNGGVDFPAEVLEEWRDCHADTVRQLLTSTRRLLPTLMLMEKDARIAQIVVDEIGSKSAVYDDLNSENWKHVVWSFSDLRRTLNGLRGRIQIDTELPKRIKGINTVLQKFMRQVEIDDTGSPQCGDTTAGAYLLTTRTEVGREILAIRERYDVSVPGTLSQLLPQNIRLGRSRP